MCGAVDVVVVVVVVVCDVDVDVVVVAVAVVVVVVAAAAAAASAVILMLAWFGAVINHLVTFDTLSPSGNFRDKRGAHPKVSLPVAIERYVVGYDYVVYTIHSKLPHFTASCCDTLTVSVATG